MRNVAIVLFDKIEVLDFAAPFEVFSVCGLRGNGPAPFNVFTVAEHRSIIARNDLHIDPSYTLNECPSIDILIVPGGGGYHNDGTPFGSRKEMNNPVLLDWIRRQNETAEYILSVCTGSLILGRAGLLDGLEATTHWAAIDQLREAAPNAKLVTDRRWVDNGRIVLSAGVSAGLDMSLHVIAKLLGNEVANENARYMEYDHWRG